MLIYMVFNEALLTTVYPTHNIYNECYENNKFNSQKAFNFLSFLFKNLIWDLNLFHHNHKPGFLFNIKYNNYFLLPIDIFNNTMNL